MSKHCDEKKFAELGLRKVTAYVHETVASSTSVEPNVAGALGSSIPEIVKNDAYRKKIARERQKEMGLTQINLIVRDTDEIREQLSSFAKRLIESNCWNDAIIADPAVQPILASLEHAKIRLGRIDDLEQRHRRTYPFIQFHNDLMVSRGIRRFFLYLAGVVPSLAYKNGERNR